MGGAVVALVLVRVALSLIRMLGLSVLVAGESVLDEFAEEPE